ncbi:MAG: L-2-hydroxyglutarate oxidase [Deltaproteobacteria bacterium]|nr:MAG: L-2-hydroxyglutarate oxidase [Deltaproteobacteria bacterium]
MRGETFEIAIIGGGIVGIATAYHLYRHRSCIVLEAEGHLAAHQSGHNSGVIHSGLYYPPGSLKARNCIEGREILYAFCQKHGIPHERCGKLVVATKPEEVPYLEELLRRGRANGLEGLRRLAPEEIEEYEPHVRGITALFVPQTGITDFGRVTEVMAQEIEAGGGTIATDRRVVAIERHAGRFHLVTPEETITARHIIGCAGLQADRIARMCGIEPEIRIIPFRGEFYALIAERRGIVRNLVYPVPDPAFPFLGVHFTRTVTGEVEAGPNALLALHREGYHKTSFSFRDTCEILRYPGFWRLVGRYGRTGLAEYLRSLSRRSFVRALERLVPEVRARDVVFARTGVRAQAVDRRGRLLDDFQIRSTPASIHVLNAPSPAATASLSIGRSIARLALERFFPGNTPPQSD